MKHVAIKLLAFLLLGAIVNVAVGWGWAFQADYGADVGSQFCKVRWGISACEVNGTYEQGIPYKDWAVSISWPRGGLCAVSSWRDRRERADVRGR
jgi:hypothetical protein